MSETHLRIRRLLLNPAEVAGLPRGELARRIEARLAHEAAPVGEDAAAWTDWLARALREPAAAPATEGEKPCG